VHIAAAPTVAAQAEYWYEDERVQLAQQVGTQIDVFVDPSVHPERPRVIWGDENLPSFAPIRVGDEFEVELLHTRLPNATSAAAIVAGRLIEVENAANAIGKTIKIRILDVDGSDILAEARTRIEAVTPIGEARGAKKRRRGGRGRKRELTPAEQTAELRELAEEAEKGLGGRTSIGISTVEEVDAKAAGPKTTAQKAADGRVTTLLPGTSTGSGHGTPLTGVAGARGAVLPGERLSGDRVTASATGRPSAPIPLRQPQATPAASTGPVSGEAEGEEGAHRRRRRRRGRGRGGEVAAHGAAPVIAVSPLIADAELEDDEDEATVAVGQTNGAAIGENGERKRRRRRRRRRGRGPGDEAGTGQPAAASGLSHAAASGQAPSTGSGQAVPERHIFRVGPDGAQATGETAPPVPSRAIAPWNRKRGDVAVEPPPPVITAPPERGEAVKAARPTRTRRTPATATATKRGGALEQAEPVRALPAPRAAPAAEAKSRRTRTTAAAATKAAAAPATEAAEKKPRARAATAKKTPAKAAAGTKKAAGAKKAPAAKKTTRKKTAAV
jgi:hypothetical protein